MSEWRRFGPGHTNGTFYVFPGEGMWSGCWALWRNYRGYLECCNPAVHYSEPDQAKAAAERLE